MQEETNANCVATSPQILHERAALASKLNVSLASKFHTIGPPMGTTWQLAVYFVGVSRLSMYLRPKARQDSRFG